MSHQLKIHHILVIYTYIMCANTHTSISVYMYVVDVCSGAGFVTPSIISYNAPYYIITV